MREFANILNLTLKMKKNKKQNSLSAGEIFTVFELMLQKK